MGHELREAEPGDARLKLLRETSELTSGCVTSIDSLLDAAAELVCRAMADTCVFGVLFDHGSKIHPLGVYHRDAERRRKLHSVSELAWERVGGVSEQVLSMGKPGLFASVELTGASHTGSWATAFFEDPRIHTALIVPMRALGVAMGIMALARTPPTPAFGEDDIPFAQLVGDRLGLAVHALHLQEELDRPAMTAAVGGQTTSASIAGLTPREREVLRLIAEGLTSREIGEQVFLSVRTVEWHRARLMAKLGTSKRSELIALARSLRP
jgi:DNA-binding CsgD family transcriptional regulator